MHAHVRTLEVDCADQGTTNRINERTNYNGVGKRAEVIIYASPAILVIPKRGRKEHRRYAWRNKKAGEAVHLVTLRAAKPVVAS